MLKTRVLFHNSGTKPVVFKTETWHQSDRHSARDAKGSVINVGNVLYTGETPMETYRLEPGEYVSVLGHGIGIGEGQYVEERSTGSIGAWIEAKKGDEVSFSSLVDASREGWTGPDDPKDPVELWKTVVRQRVEREAPLPSSSADRELVIRRVTLDLFGESPTAEEIATFIADNAQDAFAKLTARLQMKQRIETFVGQLPTGESKFRVIAADPNAAKAPRTTTSPGRYVLGDGVHLQVRQVNDNGKRTNSATILFLSSDPSDPKPYEIAPPKPYEIAFYTPDAPYAFVWQRGANTLWVTEISEGSPIRPWLLGSPERPGPQKVTVRAFDFSNPANVKLSHVSSSENGGDWSWGKIVPAAFHQPVLNALGDRGKRLRDFIEPQKVKPAGASAARRPKLPEEAYAKLGVHCQKFREEDAKRDGGELMGGVLEPSKPADREREPLVLGVRTASDAQWRMGGTARVGLVVRNCTGSIGQKNSGSDVKFSYTGRIDNGLSIVAVDEAGKEHQAAIAQFDGELGFQQMLLPVAHVAIIKEFTLRFDPEKRDVSEPHVAAFHLPPGKYKLRFKWNDAHPDVAHEGEWTGELVNEEFEFTLTEAVASSPASEASKTAEQKPYTAWGKEVGGLQAGLGFKAGEKRAYRHGETANIVLRVRNVGTEEVEFKHIWAFFVENPPAITDADGKPGIAKGDILLYEGASVD